MTGEAESFFGLLFGDIGDFKHHSTSFNFSYEKLWFTFATAHFDIKRFLGDRGMWEDANPDFTTTFDVAGDSLTSCLELAAVDALVV